MTLIIDENIANTNLILRFMGALEREDYFLCQTIKEKLKTNQLDSNKIEDLKIFIRTCEKITCIDTCLNTIEMLDSLRG